MKKGDIVIVNNTDTYNGSKWHPAIVNEIFSDTCINVTMFPDNSDPEPVTSVQHYSEMSLGIDLDKCCCFMSVDDYEIYKQNKELEDDLPF